MSIPPRLAGKLNDVLGSDAAEDLVNWMDEMRADHAETRQELTSLRRDVADLTKTMNEKFDAVNQKFDVLNQKFDALAEKFDALNARFDKGLEHSHGLGQRVEHLRGQFIAWNAAFWLTAVTAIVGLLQFLQR